MNAPRVVRVTAEDHVAGVRDVTELVDDYALITAGTCRAVSFVSTQQADGSSTHVVTIAGVRRPA